VISANAATASHSQRANMRSSVRHLFRLGFIGKKQVWDRPEEFGTGWTRDGSVAAAKDRAHLPTLSRFNWAASVDRGPRLDTPASS
jgi:hypothetical protein